MEFPKLILSEYEQYLYHLDKEYFKSYKHLIVRPVQALEYPQLVLQEDKNYEESIRYDEEALRKHKRRKEKKADIDYSNMEIVLLVEDKYLE